MKRIPNMILTLSKVTTRMILPDMLKLPNVFDLDTIKLF